MIAYASLTRSRRNLDALRAANAEAGHQPWRLLVSRADRTQPPADFRYCLDNGAWSDFKADRPFNGPAFERLIDLYGAGADFTVLPDIVAGGMASLDLSMRWLNRVMATCSLVLIAAQDGMTPEDLAPFVGPNVGVFLGGSTEWKLATMRSWGDACAGWGCWYHVARVNTARRFRRAHLAGAVSVDGSSASRYSADPFAAGRPPPAKSFRPTGFLTAPAEMGAVGSWP